MLGSALCQLRPGVRVLGQLRVLPLHCCAYSVGSNTATPLPLRSCHGPMCSRRTPRLRVNRRVVFQESDTKKEKVLYCMFTTGEKLACCQLSACPMYIRAIGFTQLPRCAAPPSRCTPAGSELLQPCHDAAWPTYEFHIVCPTSKLS